MFKSLSLSWPGTSAVLLGEISTYNWAFHKSSFIFSMTGFGTGYNYHRASAGSL